MNRYQVSGIYRGFGCYCVIVDHDIFTIYIEKDKYHIGMVENTSSGSDTTGFRLLIDSKMAKILFSSGQIEVTKKDRAEIKEACSEWLKRPITEENVCNGFNITLSTNRTYL